MSICLFFDSLLLQAYVQQLESSRLKLSQLEQELQGTRQQVCFHRQDDILGFNYYGRFLFSVMFALFPVLDCRAHSFRAQKINAIQQVEMVLC